MRRNTMAAVAAMMLMATGAGCDADPAAWGPNTSTYNGNVVVEGWGRYYNDRASWSRSDMTVTDRRNDGNSVYGKTGFLYHGPNSVACGGGGSCWYLKNTKSTGEWSNEQRTESLYESLVGDASQSRGQLRVCAQMGWPVPDSCSNDSFVTFGY